jgi:hypothetical protein
MCEHPSLPPPRDVPPLNPLLPPSLRAGATCAMDDSVAWDGNPGDAASARVYFDTAFDVAPAVTTLAVAFSDVLGGGGWAGANGNIAADPQLLPGSGYVPAVGSPVINAGDPAYSSPGDTDRLGGARVLLGRVDMGASEFGNGNTPPALSDLFKATVSLGANQVGPPLLPSAAGGGRAVEERGWLGVLLLGTRVHPDAPSQRALPLAARPLPPPCPPQVLLADWGDVYTDADGDAFTLQAGGGPTGLAENGVLSVGDAANKTLTFTPVFGSKAAKFSTRALDIKGGDSGIGQISLALGQPVLCPSWGWPAPRRLRCPRHIAPPPESLLQPCAAAATPLSPSHTRYAGGGALLAKPSLESVTPAAKPQASAAGAKKAKAGVTLFSAAGACSGVQVVAPGPATVQVTAGTAQVQLNAKGKTKNIGAPLGVWLDILLAGALANATADAACHIKVPGAIKAGGSRARVVAAKKLSACYAALRLALAECSKPLQARATAIAGKKYKQGLPSKAVAFTPSCSPCSG